MNEFVVKFDKQMKLIKEQSFNYRREKKDEVNQEASK